MSLKDFSLEEKVAIAPGLIRTHMTEAFWKEENGAMGKPREVGLMAVYLTSAASDYVTGRELVIDGGIAICCAVKSPSQPTRKLYS